MRDIRYPGFVNIWSLSWQHTKNNTSTCFLWAQFWLRSELFERSCSLCISLATFNVGCIYRWKSESSLIFLSHFDQAHWEYMTTYRNPYIHGIVPDTTGTPRQSSSITSKCCHAHGFVFWLSSLELVWWRWWEVTAEIELLGFRLKQICNVESSFMWLHDFPHGKLALEYGD